MMRRSRGSSNTKYGCLTALRWMQEQQNPPMSHNWMLLFHCPTTRQSIRLPHEQTGDHPLHHQRNFIAQLLGWAPWHFRKSPRSPFVNLRDGWHGSVIARCSLLSSPAPVHGELVNQVPKMAHRCCNGRSEFAGEGGILCFRDIASFGGFLGSSL